MDVNIIEVLKAEHADLLKKVGAIEAMLAAYGSTDIFRGGLAAPPQSLSHFVPKAVLPRAVVSNRASEYGKKVRKVARALVEARGNTPTPTRDVVAAIKDQGIAISGQNELNAVSALLSRSGEFENVPQKGWVVAEPTLNSAPVYYENGTSVGKPTDVPEAGEDATSSNDTETLSRMFQ